MPDMETCSWCTAEVPDSTLRELPDGARVCRPCHADYRANPAQIWAV